MSNVKFKLQQNTVLSNIHVPLYSRVARGKKGKKTFLIYIDTDYSIKYLFDCVSVRAFTFNHHHRDHLTTTRTNLLCCHEEDTGKADIETQRRRQRAIIGQRYD
jgi:hypothetical protein